MNVKSLLAILFLFVFYNHSWAASCVADPFTLKSGQWTQITLPCNHSNREGAFTVDRVFGAAFAGKIYDTDWVVFSWNGSSYLKMTENGDSGVDEKDLLLQGVGYWIIQVTDGTIQLEMPGNAVATPTIDCIDGIEDPQCFTIKLKTPNSVGWNMLGNPYSVSLPVKNLRIRSFADGLSPPNEPGNFGSTLATAQEKKVFHSTMFWYGGEDLGYVRVNSAGADSNTLSPWQGFWGATLENAAGTKPELRFSIAPPQPAN